MAPYQASNSDHLRHFTDPHHPLVKTQYSHDQTGLCSICLLKLSGVHGYGCYHCNIHVHSECAGHFKETISFFAHPSHALELRRSPGRVCNICRGDCPQNSFVYRCVECDFDVHPLCALLPERVAGGGGASHPWRDLRMVSSSAAGSCSECHHPLPTWRYVCSSFGLQLHVTCAIPIDPAAKGTQAGSSSHGTAFRQRGVGDPAGQGWYYGHATPAPCYNYNPAFQFQTYGGGPAGQGGYFGGPVMQGGYGYPIQQGSYYYPPATAMPAGGGHGDAAGSSGGIFGNSSGMMTGIAGFLASVAINDGSQRLRVPASVIGLGLLIACHVVAVLARPAGQLARDSAVLGSTAACKILLCTRGAL